MLAYYLRFHVEFLAIKSVPVADPFSYLKGAIFLAALWCFLLWRDGLYEGGLQGVSSPMLRIRSLLYSGFWALGIMMIISFMYRGAPLSRQVYLMTGALACVAMSAGRLLFGGVSRRLAERGIVNLRLAVVGSERQAEQFLLRLKRRRLPIKVVGFFHFHASEGTDAGALGTVLLLGSLADLPEIHKQTPFDILVISSLAGRSPGSSTTDDSVLALVNFCEEARIALYALPSFLDVAVSQREVATLSGVALIRLQDSCVRPAYAAMKRVIDVCVSLALLVVGMPLWLIIAALIKLTSPGPVLFVQIRAGVYGRPFRMYKFRSMVKDAAERLQELIDLDNLQEPVFKIENDPRVTPVGRLLRRTSLDEIPQLLNVVKGEMSLVGPRPEELDMVKRYDQWQLRRLKIKPGVTGFQQINNRGESSLANRTRYDLLYMKHQGLSLDLYILLKTILVVFKGSGVTH